MLLLLSFIFSADLTHRNTADDLGKDVALGRVHHIEGLAHHNDHRCHRHQDCRDAKGQGVAGVVAKALNVLPDLRGEDGGDERAGVDGEVEDGEEGLQLPLLLRQLELIPTKC